jgi:hypothetical protein
MSASTTQPMTGRTNQAAPIGAIVILAGALALGAVGIAIGQGYKATPASVAVPADVEAALIAHRAGERAPLWSIEEVLAAQRAGEKAPLFSAQDSLLIQRLGEFRDKALALRNTGVPASASQYGYGYPPAIINGTATWGQSGLNGTDVIPRSVFYPATWGQSGLNGTDVIPRSVFNGPATGAQKGLGGKTEHTTRPPVRRAGHYHN